MRLIDQNRGILSQTSVTWWTGTTCTMSVLSLARSNFGELCPNPRSWTWTCSPQLTTGMAGLFCLSLLCSLSFPLAPLFLLAALVASHEKLQPSIWRASEHQKILCNVKTLWETIIWKENLTHFLLCAWLYSYLWLLIVIKNNDVFPTAIC